MSDFEFLHPTVVELMLEYKRQGGAKSLPPPQAEPWCERVLEGPTAERVMVGEHLAVLAARFAHLGRETADEAAGQLLALAAIALEGVADATQEFEASGIDRSTGRDAARKLGSAELKFDPTRSGGPADMGGLLGVVGRPKRKKRR